MNEIIREKISILPRDIDLIVGIPRSGMLPANLLALYLNLPYTDIHSFINGFIYGSGSRKQYFKTAAPQKVLIIDDSIGSGAALKKSKKELEPIAHKYTMEFCVIYASQECKDVVDYFFEIIPTPRYFEWNIFNHPGLKNACFDIDGVLCPDPTEDQNDDGQQYIDFITNTPSLHIPSCKVGAIVTSRLEKYRSQTEQWLKKHGIEYQALFMIDLPDMRARQLANNHATHKATIYAKGKYDLFIESNLNQSLQINSLTNKPVFCTDNFEMIYESKSVIYNIKSGRSLPFLRKIALKLRSQLKTFF
jgi:uncharacterized HAD superfamily protein